jgi:hypothetical protein
MTNRSRKFTKDEVTAAFEGGKFEELATWGIEKDSIEWAAKKCQPCVQRHFNDLQDHTISALAAYDELDRLMNERAIELYGEPIFDLSKPKKPLIVEGFDIDQVGDTYTLSFRITDPNERVKKFEEMVEKWW